MQLHPRIAIIGAGLMGRWHAFAARKCKAVVVAIIDRDITSAKRLSGKYDALAFQSMQEFIQSHQQVDALHICTPGETHEEILLAAMNAGISAFVEKPFALDGDATRRLLATAVEQDVKVCPVHQFAFQRSVADFAKNRGRLGDIMSISFNFCTAGGVGMTVKEWQVLVADILPHPLSVLQLIFAPFALSKADWRIVKVGEGSWELSAVIDEILVRLWISVLARPTKAHMEVQGTAGSYESNLFHDYGVWQSGQVSKVTKVTAPFASSLRHFAGAGSNLIARLLRGEPAYPGLATLMAAFYAADAQNLPISHDQICEIAALRDRFLVEAANGNEAADKVKTAAGLAK